MASARKIRRLLEIEIVCIIPVSLSLVGGPRLGRARTKSGCRLIPRFGLIHSRAYNEIMARGWESKSVEAQIESAAGKPKAAPKLNLNPEQLQNMREKENLELSRTRVQRELASSENPRYQEILRKALADLDGKLARLEPAKKAVAVAAR